MHSTLYIYICVYIYIYIYMYIGSFVRKSYVSTQLCPVVIRAYLCASEGRSWGDGRGPTHIYIYIYIYICTYVSIDI